MKLPIYQIDAFAEEPFEGNPAAIVPLEKWLSDKTMQAIAEENNLAEMHPDLVEKFSRMMEESRIPSEKFNFGR